MARRRVAAVQSFSDMPADLQWGAWRVYLDPKDVDLVYGSPGFQAARRAASFRLRYARREFLSVLTDMPAGSGVFEFLTSHGLSWSDLGTARASADGTHIYGTREEAS